jgi:opacity protein-like surface antigen
MRIALVAGLLSLPALASAQSFEVFAATGVLQLWDDEGNIGSGVPIGGGIGFKSPHGWGIEFLAETQKATRTFESDVQFDSTVVAAQARFIKYFGSGRTQPYAGGGLGVTEVESTRSAPAGCALVNNVFTCTSRDVFDSSSTDASFSGFAGVRIPAGNLMFVRPEFQVSKFGEHVRLGGIVAIGASW